MQIVNRDASKGQILQVHHHRWPSKAPQFGRYAQILSHLVQSAKPYQNLLIAFVPITGHDISSFWMPEIQKTKCYYVSYQNNKYGSIFRLWVQILVSLWDCNYFRSYLLSIHVNIKKSVLNILKKDQYLRVENTQFQNVPVSFYMSTI